MGVIGTMIRFVLMLAWFREVFRMTLQVSLSCRLTFRWQDLVSLDPCIVLMSLRLIRGSTILLGLICCWLELVFRNCGSGDDSVKSNKIFDLR